MAVRSDKNINNSNNNNNKDGKEEINFISEGGDNDDEYQIQGKGQWANPHDYVRRARSLDQNIQDTSDVISTGLSLAGFGLDREHELPSLMKNKNMSTGELGDLNRSIKRPQQRYQQRYRASQIEEELVGKRRRRRSDSTSPTSSPSVVFDLKKIPNDDVVDAIFDDMLKDRTFFWGDARKNLHNISKKRKWALVCKMQAGDDLQSPKSGWSTDTLVTTNFQEEELLQNLENLKDQPHKISRILHQLEKQLRHESFCKIFLDDNHITTLADCSAKIQPNNQFVYLRCFKTIMNYAEGRHFIVNCSGLVDYFCSLLNDKYTYLKIRTLSCELLLLLTYVDDQLGYEKVLNHLSPRLKSWLQQVNLLLSSKGDPVFDSDVEKLYTKDNSFFLQFTNTEQLRVDFASTALFLINSILQALTDKERKLQLVKRLKENGIHRSFQLMKLNLKNEVIDEQIDIYTNTEHVLMVQFADKPSFTDLFYGTALESIIANTRNTSSEQSFGTLIQSIDEMLKSKTSSESVKILKALIIMFQFLETNLYNNVEFEPESVFQNSINTLIDNLESEEIARRAMGEITFLQDTVRSLQEERYRLEKLRDTNKEDIIQKCKSMEMLLKEKNLELRQLQNQLDLFKNERREEKKLLDQTLSHQQINRPSYHAKGTTGATLFENLKSHKEGNKRKLGKGLGNALTKSQRIGSLAAYVAADGPLTQPPMGLPPGNGAASTHFGPIPESVDGNTGNSSDSSGNSNGNSVSSTTNDESHDIPLLPKLPSGYVSASSKLRQQPNLHSLPVPPMAANKPISNPVPSTPQPSPSALAPPPPPPPPLPNSLTKASNPPPPPPLPFMQKGFDGPRSSSGSPAPPPPPPLPDKILSSGMATPPPILASEEPKQNLKQIHWEKIDDVEKTVWEDNGQREETVKDLEIGGVFKEVQSVFQLKNSTVKKVKKSDSSGKRTDQLKSFLSRDLAQQFGINLHMYSQYPVEQFVLKVLRCDNDVLQNISVLEFFNSEELTNIPASLSRSLEPYSTNFKNNNPPSVDPSELERPDRIFLELCYNLRSYWRERSQCLLVFATYERDYYDLVYKLQNIDDAIQKIKNAFKLKQLLYIIMEIGNYMNKKNVSGIRLNSLSKLSFVKSSVDNNLSFLHFIEKLIRMKYPEIYHFTDELNKAEALGHISIDHIQLECEDYCAKVNGIVRLTTEGILSKQSSLHPKDEIMHKVKYKISRAKTKSQLLWDQYKLINSDLEKLMKYFGESPNDKEAKNSFFANFGEFSIIFKKCARENIEKEEAYRVYEQRKKLLDTRRSTKTLNSKRSAAINQPGAPNKLHHKATTGQEQEAGDCDADDVDNDEDDAVDLLLSKLRGVKKDPEPLRRRRSTRMMDKSILFPTTTADITDTSSSDELRRTMINGHGTQGEGNNEYHQRQERESTSETGKTSSSLESRYSQRGELLQKTQAMLNDIQNI